MATPASSKRMTSQADLHSVRSVLRERIVEHVFVGEVLRRLWQRGVTDVEVLRSEFDAGGYDLVLSRGAVVRHLQLKSIVDGGKAVSVIINLKLAQKPSGCVLWIVVDHALNLRSYRWLGARPGEPLPDLRDGPPARHTRATSAGVKQLRAGHRVVHRRRFEVLDNLDVVLERLFGTLPNRPADDRDVDEIAVVL
ncbi:hypothetical protein ACU8YE_00080 [Ralstonia sp. VS2407]|uniref:Uncharacterized protein n=2 Tax=Burkholderiaceae TaxID=119060 RepID=A0AAD2APV0_9RALS|nr:hypothetical protein [Ralstonia wenshanensis]CAJ0686057.1 hypothetical protein LMG18091_00508 [Ralstonia wenshanensis]